MDTTLSHGELIKAKKQFEEFDVDGDGVVSWDDYLEFLLRKKRSAVHVKLRQKQKQLLQNYGKKATDAFKHFRTAEDTTTSDSAHAAKKGKKHPPTKKKKRTERKLTPEEQAELAALDPFAPGHTEAEKTRIWARINEIVGNDESTEDEDSDSIEKVSYSESASSEDKSDSDDRVVSSNEEEAKDGKTPTKNRNLANSTPSSPHKLSRTTSEKGKKYLTVKTSSQAQKGGPADSSEGSESSSKKAISGIKRSASTTAASVSKKSSKIVANVLKKAEEGAKAAKSKIIKEEQQKEQVEDPDDPALFASAYKHKKT